MIRAHELDADGVIINTIVVESLDFLPNLIAAENGGYIGQYIVNDEWVWHPREIENFAARARSERDAKLAATDWWVAKANESGVPLSEEQIAYRQALRDLPDQEGWPISHIWPVEPV